MVNDVDGLEYQLTVGTKLEPKVPAEFTNEENHNLDLISKHLLQQILQKKCQPYLKVFWKLVKATPIVRLTNDYLVGQLRKIKEMPPEIRILMSNKKLTKSNKLFS